MSTAKDRDDAIIRDILVRVGETEHLSQRTLSKELGIALGMTNAYLKRCVRKGLVKVRQAPPNRYIYYLTPRGFTEKSRLTADFLSDSLTFFRRARIQYCDILDHCADRGWSRIGFAGASELGEIAILYGRDRDLTLVGVVEPEYASDQFMELAVVARPEDLQDPHAIIITSVRAPQQAYDLAVVAYGENRVQAPRLLQVKRSEVSAR